MTLIKQGDLFEMFCSYKPVQETMKEHTVSVSISVGQGGPKEVKNDFFKDDGDAMEPEAAPSVPNAKEAGELDKLEESMQSWGKHPTFDS